MRLAASFCFSLLASSFLRHISEFLPILRHLCRWRASTFLQDVCRNVAAMLQQYADGLPLQLASISFIFYAHLLDSQAVSNTAFSSARTPFLRTQHLDEPRKSLAEVADHIVYIISDFISCILPPGPVLGLTMSFKTLFASSALRLIWQISSVRYFFSANVRLAASFLLFVTRLQFLYDAISLYLYVRTSFSGPRR